MVQLHAALERRSMPRPTTDIDVVLHVETGSISGSEIVRTLNRLGYVLQMPLSTSSPAHRFIRQYGSKSQFIDVMVADHGVSKPPFMIGGRKPFLIPAGTQALKRTFICRVKDHSGLELVALSIPTVLAAMIMKAAAYREDTRDRERHLEDAALLSTMLGDPLVLVPQLHGSDRSRIISLRRHLVDSNHPAWARIDEKSRREGQYSLDVLASNPQEFETHSDVDRQF